MSKTHLSWQCKDSTISILPVKCVIINHCIVKMLGIQMRKKWKSVFHMPDLFTTQVLILQIGGHWPVDYSKILPKSWANLSKYINYMYFAYVTFLNWHMCVLYSTKFLINFLSDEEVPVTNLSDSLMSVILHGYGGFASIYVQIYHEDCKRMLQRMNTMFRQRSSRGEFFFPVWRY